MVNAYNGIQPHQGRKKKKKNEVLTPVTTQMNSKIFMLNENQTKNAVSGTPYVKNCRILKLIYNVRNYISGYPGIPKGCE